MGRESEERRPTADDLVTDMVNFGVGPHDQRVVHGDWVHYVKVVPGGRASSRADLVQGWAVTRALKVGVVRVPNPKGWKVDRARVVCKYVLPAGADPLPHLDELAEQAAAGEWSRTP